jgi:prepilin-type N-terminal cleavage/methylation domain-containing protein
MRTRRAERGFTLLEVLVALGIFAFVAGAAMQTMSSTHYMASSAKRARELRMLAERKLGEILAFEQHFDDNLDGDIGDDWPEYGAKFRGWKWQLEIRDVTVFGISNQEDAQYFFGPPTDEEKNAALNPQQGASGTGGQPGAPAAKKGEPQQLRELTLRVSSPPEEGSSDAVQIITLAPLVARKTAAGGTATGK